MSSKPSSILIVDDERHVTQIVKIRLEREGYEVFVANDGEQALETALQVIPQLVVTDFQMPYMSGLELATALRADEKTKHIPVLMVTGRGHKVSPAELAVTNVQQVLCKPFSPRELVEHVAEALSYVGRRDVDDVDQSREAA